MAAILRCACPRCNGRVYTNTIEYLADHDWFAHGPVRSDEVTITEQLSLFDWTHEADT